MTPSAARPPRGFTLAEVMVTLAVLVILLAVALPSFREVFVSQAVKTASYDLFSGLLRARSEAISRNTTVSIVPQGGDWSQGWTISDASGEVLQLQARMPRVSIRGPGRVSYNGAGRVSSGGTAIDLRSNGGRAATARCIRVELSGRPVQKQEPCG
jgi:type IV fimbrial biogenesis protein FimT